MKLSCLIGARTFITTHRCHDAMIRRSFALLAGALVAVAAAATRTRIYAAFSTGGIYEMLFAPTAPIRSQFVQAKSQVCPQKPQFGLHVARLAPGADGTIFVSGGSPQGNDDDDNDDGGGVGVGTIFSTGLDEQSTCNVFANVTGTVYGVGDMVPDGGGGDVTVRVLRAARIEGGGGGDSLVS